MSVPLDIGPIQERNANELLLLAVTDRRVLLAEVDRLRAGLQHIADDPGRPDMTTEPLDPAAIMAEHCSDGTDEDGGPGCVECSGAGWADPWPCLPYRLAAEVDRLQRQHQGQAEHITLLRTAVDRLTAALIERDTELTRLRAAEQRVRALHRVNTGAPLRGWCICGQRPCPTIAALDGGQP